MKQKEKQERLAKDEHINSRQMNVSVNALQEMTELDFCHIPKVS